jgi:hypothetical protein
MSIETDLKRIADATEQILKLMQPSAATAGPGVITTVNLTQAAPATYTEDEVRTAVRDYMNATSKQKAIELLIKYGALKDKPMIKDVKDVAGLMKEIADAKTF